jgi:hypothetical protein
VSVSRRFSGRSADEYGGTGASAAQPLNDCPPVEVSRRIAAPPDAVLEVLTTPAGQVEIDGSGMLHGSVSTTSWLPTDRTPPS